MEETTVNDATGRRPPPVRVPHGCFRLITAAAVLLHARTRRTIPLSLSVPPLAVSPPTDRFTAAPPTGHAAAV